MVSRWWGPLYDERFNAHLEEQQEIAEVASMADSDAIAHARVDSKPIKFDTKAVAAYANGLRATAKKVRDMRADLETVDGFSSVLDEVPGARGLHMAAMGLLARAAEDLKTSFKRTVALGIRYQQVDASYPGTGVPTYVWDQVANQKGSRKVKGETVHLADEHLDELWQAAEATMNQRRIWETAAGAAGNVRLFTLDAANVLRVSAEVLEAGTRLSVARFNEEMAALSKGRTPHMRRVAKIQQWLGVDEKTAKAISLAYSRKPRPGAPGGTFESVDDLLARVDLSADEKFKIYDTFGRGEPLLRMPLRVQDIGRHLRPGLARAFVAGRVAARTPTYNAALARLRALQQVKGVRYVVDGVPVVGTALDVYAVFSPTSSRLARASGTLGIGATAAGLTGVGAPVAVGLGVAAAVVGGADYLWNRHINNLKEAEYKRVYPVSYRHEINRIREQLLVDDAVEEQNKEECRLDIGRPHRVVEAVAG